MCSLINLNDVNFNDIICFVVCAKKKNVDLGFLSQTRLVMFLQHLEGFSNHFTDFEGCWENCQINTYIVNLVVLITVSNRF